MVSRSWENPSGAAGRTSIPGSRCKLSCNATGRYRYMHLCRCCSKLSGGVSIWVRALRGERIPEIAFGAAPGAFDRGWRREPDMILSLSTTRGIFGPVDQGRPGKGRHLACRVGGTRLGEGCPVGSHNIRHLFSWSPCFVPE